MAGIGFTLRKYFKGNDLVAYIQGGFYSVLLFKAIISYCYAFSLIFFGLIEMPITRYLADKMFLKDFGPVKPIFAVCMSLNAVFTVFFCGTALFFTSLPFYTCLSICALFFAILTIWCAMIFLSAAKNYTRIVLSFVIGSAVSGLASYYLGDMYGLFGYLTGFATGQIVLAVFLSLFVFLEYNYADYFTLGMIGYFRRHAILALTGFLYYAGIWVDKFVFWLSNEGEHIQDFFYTNLYYDTALFLAYLTIVPAMAIFMVLIETTFYKKLSAYFIAIESKENYPMIERKIDDIFASLKHTVSTMLKVQAFITIFVWYFSDEILALVNFPAKISIIFKYGIIGAFFQSLFLILNIILLYFEAAKIVLFNYLLFFVTSMVFADFTSTMDIRYWGLGYVVSSFLVVLVSFRGINLRMQNINYNVFMSQPLSTKNFYEKPFA